MLNGIETVGCYSFWVSVYSQKQPSTAASDSLRTHCHQRMMRISDKVRYRTKIPQTVVEPYIAFCVGTIIFVTMAAFYDVLNNHYATPIVQTLESFHCSLLQCVYFQPFI